MRVLFKQMDQYGTKQAEDFDVDEVPRAGDRVYWRGSIFRVEEVLWLLDDDRFTAEIVVR